MNALGALLLELMLAVLFSASASAANDSWPEFRGPAGQGLSTATNVPVHWSPTEGISWKQEIPGTGWSSPVLVDGRLYLTTAVTAESGDVSLRALSINAADGKIVWDVEAIQGAAADAKMMHEKNSLASPTPIVADGRIYVHFGHMGTAALDLKGNVLWRQTDLKYRPMHGNGGSPALVGDLLIFSCDGEKDPFLVALDRADGQVRWRQPRSAITGKSFSFSTPLVVEVDGAKQLISPASGYVGGYNPSDGQEIWHVSYGEGYSVIPRPVFSHGLLFVCSGYNKAQLLAIDPAGAKGDATATNVRWQTDRGVSLTPSVLVVGDELYYVADNGAASCVDAATGAAHWSKRLGGDFSASPVYADGRIYFLSEAGVASVVKASTEYELLATNDMEERALASPAVADGAIYLRTQSHLWRVGE
jgi:outer membrane protein assembly factor BamB